MIRGASLKQVALSDVERCYIKKSAAQLSSTLEEYYEQIFLGFLSFRISHKEKIYYIVTPSLSETKYTSIWVKSSILAKLEAVAKKDCVSVNRVMYTAIIYAINKKNYLQCLGD